MGIRKITPIRPFSLAAFAVGVALLSPAEVFARADGSAEAIPSDALIEGAKLCTRHLPRYEREYGIPVHLLSAISSTETGRWHKALKIAVPWPWTINAGGKGYYFESKQEALSAVRRLQAQGVRSIDVGCMQVNLVHHANAFARLEDAFDPETNIAYAARFLRNLYEESGSWKQAAAAYHSKTPSLGEKYIGRVFASWYKIIDKVRAAKDHVQTAQSAQPAPAAASADAAQAGGLELASPVPSSAAPDVAKIGQAVLPPGTPQAIASSVISAAASSRTARPVELDESAVARQVAQEPMPARAVAARPEVSAPKVAAYKPPHMKVIQVTRKPSPDRGNPVMVVRPEIDDTQVAGVQALTSRNTGFSVEPYRSPRRDSTLTVAANTQPPAAVGTHVVNEAASAPNVAPAIPDFAPTAPAAAAVVAAPSAPQARVVEVGRTTSSRKAGPNFIFQ